MLSNTLWSNVSKMSLAIHTHKLHLNGWGRQARNLMLTGTNPTHSDAALYAIYRASRVADRANELSTLTPLRANLAGGLAGRHVAFIKAGLVVPYSLCARHREPNSWWFYWWDVRLPKDNKGAHGQQCSAVRCSGLACGWSLQQQLRVCLYAS